MALLWWLFDRNYADARRSEILTLTDRELVVERVSPEGEREVHRLEAYWLKIYAGERLIVTSRRNRVVIGRFLSPESARRGCRRTEGRARRDARPALRARLGSPRSAG